MPVLKRANPPRDAEGDPVLVAALYDGTAQDRRIELLYQDAPFDFGLFSTTANGGQDLRASALARRRPGCRATPGASQSSPMCADFAAGRTKPPFPPETALAA